MGCETFYEKEELNRDGECFEHPGKKLDAVEEENYFFALSKYQDKLIKLIESDELEIVPQERKNEVLSFVKSGLKDISISEVMKGQRIGACWCREITRKEFMCGSML